MAEKQIFCFKPALSRQGGGADGKPLHTPAFTCVKNAISQMREECYTGGLDGLPSPSLFPPKGTEKAPFSPVRGFFFGFAYPALTTIVHRNISPGINPVKPRFSEETDTMI